MAKAESRATSTDRPDRLIQALTRDWAQSVVRRLPPEFVGHMRGALRELFLAASVLCDSALKTAEETTAAARRRVQRIPITGAKRPTPRRTKSRRGV